MLNCSHDHTKIDVPLIGVYIIVFYTRDLADHWNDSNFSLKRDAELFTRSHWDRYPSLSGVYLVVSIYQIIGIVRVLI